MSRLSFNSEQIVDVVRRYWDPEFDGAVAVIPSKRGSVAVVNTNDGRVVVKYADLSNEETEQNIVPARSTGIRNEVKFLRRLPPALAPALVTSGGDERRTFSMTRFIASDGLFDERSGRRSSLVPPFLRTVQSLHDSGVIHGDITPDNVVRIGEQVRLIDFELAHGLGEAALAPGLYHYLSPEAAQAILQGESPALDAAEETYAATGTALAILAGGLPNRYSTPDVSRRQALEEIAAGQRAYGLDGVPPEARALAENLREILLQPSGFRPATPQHLHQEIKEFL